MPTGSRFAAAVDWPGLARERILDLVDRESAVVWPEVEAKLADGAAAYGGGPRTVDPHHLHNARNVLLGAGDIEVTSAPTRGGSTVDVYQVSEIRGRARAVEEAAGRKRLLHARYRGWAKGTKTGSSLTGTALEAVVHESLRQAAPAAGWRLVNPARGEFGSIGGVQLPGPVDNGGFVMTFDALSGEPGPAVMVLVEAKNLREWVYPSASELYQLLAKASYLQMQRPDQPVVPVFVCRRLHHLAREMAFELGFYPIETKQQYIMPGRTEQELAEVVDELGYNLTPSAEANRYMVRHFQQLIPQTALGVAGRWRRTSEAAADTLNQLWRTTNQRKRARLLEELSTTTSEVVNPAERRAWRKTSDDPASEHITDEDDLSY